MIEPGNPKLKSVLMEGGNPLNNSNMINSKNDVSNNLNVSKKSAKGASARGKKEAKKLQKYDSNSIDEEEFQDCKLLLMDDLIQTSLTLRNARNSTVSDYNNK